MSAADEIDELGRALFAAARREKPSAELRARVLSSCTERAATAPPAAPPVRIRRVPAVGLAVALAASVALVFSVRNREDVSITIGPERAVRGQAPTAPAIPPEPELVPQPDVPSLRGEKAAPRPPARASHADARAPKVEAPRPPASLSDEIAALDRARTALSSGDATGALRMIDDYDRVLRGTRLAAEATLLRIETLARLGRSSEASDLAGRFVEANPGSALADRARAFVHARGPIGADGGTP